MPPEPDDLLAIAAYILGVLVWIVGVLVALELWVW